MVECRGEGFRHNQNVLKNKTRYRVHIPTKSLPPHLLPSSDESADRASRTPHDTPNTAGPIPKSWRPIPKEIGDKESPEWRASALSLILSGLQVDEASMPSLAELCMRVLLDAFSDLGDFERTLLPLLPSHLRFVLQRYTAIHAPLSTPRLYALVGESGHINGEFIVVGPHASLCKDAIALRPPDRQTPVDGFQDWEADDPFLDSFELQTLALLSTDISFQTVLAFPRSLTRLALIDIPTPPPILRIPVLCPSIVVLDLSFNSWLKDPDQSRAILGMVNWDKWKDLDLFGLRGCSVDQDILDRVNQNRWMDVQIILR